MIGWRICSLMKLGGFADRSVNMYKKASAIKKHGNRVKTYSHAWKLEGSRPRRGVNGLQILVLVVSIVTLAQWEWQRRSSRKTLIPLLGKKSGKAETTGNQWIRPVIIKPLGRKAREGQPAIVLANTDEHCRIVQFERYRPWPEYWLTRKGDEYEETSPDTNVGMKICIPHAQPSYDTN